VLAINEVPLVILPVIVSDCFTLPLTGDVNHFNRLAVISVLPLFVVALLLIARHLLSEKFGVNHDQPLILKDKIDRMVLGLSLSFLPFHFPST
jgi:hypothetical protein